MKRRLTKLVLFLLLGAIVNVAVAWGLVLATLTSLTGCDPGQPNVQESSGEKTPAVPEPRQIVSRLALRPDDRYLAFSVAPYLPDQRTANRQAWQAVLLELTVDEQRLRVIPGGDGSSFLAWQPGARQHHLFLLADFKRLLRYTVNGHIELVTDTEFPKEILASVGSWNPSGSMLALTWFDIRADLQSNNSGMKLALVSESNDWIPVVTDVEVADRRMAWSGDNTLYVELSREPNNVIVELEVENSDVRIVRTVAEAEWLDICGSIGGEVIFHDGVTVFRGSEPIYAPLGAIYEVTAAGSVVIVRTMSGVVVVTPDGKVIAEQRFSRDVLLGPLSPVENYLYLITAERTRIERVSALTLRDAEVIYSVYEE
ncbi:MAG: hypothetical protein IIB99_07475 [Planctomycetes bacterium]|nr:hypothetical protein [Planctomycetota bacterium]